MRAILANLDDCAVPFLSRAAVNLSWYDSKTWQTFLTHYYYKMYPLSCILPLDLTSIPPLSNGCSIYSSFYQIIFQAWIQGECWGCAYPLKRNQYSSLRHMCTKFAAKPSWTLSLNMSAGSMTAVYLPLFTLSLLALFLPPLC